MTKSVGEKYLHVFYGDEYDFMNYDGTFVKQLLREQNGVSFTLEQRIEQARGWKNRVLTSLS